MDCRMPGFPVLHHPTEFAQAHVHWIDDAFQPSHPLLPCFSPVLNLSQHQGLFPWVSSSIRWPEYWSFSFITSPSNEYSGLTSFRIDICREMFFQPITMLWHILSLIYFKLKWVLLKFTFLLSSLFLPNISCSVLWVFSPLEGKDQLSLNFSLKVLSSVLNHAHFMLSINVLFNIK